MTSRTRRRWRAVVAASAGIGVAALVACVWRTEELGWAPPAFAAKIQECPQEWYPILKDENKTNFAVPERTTDVPEFHDCQKFLVGDGTQYGPLVAIFAAWELDKVTARLDSAAGIAPLARPVPGARSDTLTPTSGATAAAPNTGASGSFGLAAALIVNLGARYRVDDFDIRPGYNCLFMWRGGKVQWKAIIVPVADEKTCTNPLGLDSVNTSLGLKVVEDKTGGNDSKAYPPVARWDYDPVSKQQYIGIKCGAAWCEIGSRNFKPNAAYTALNDRVGRIKGWFDEQYLAIIKTGTGGPTAPMPSRLKGTLIPHPDLDRYTAADFDNRWAVVGYVALDGDTQQLPFYKTKLNLERAPVGNLNTLNEIAMCMGSKARCLPAGAASKCTLDGSEPGDQVLWWGRITAATSKAVIYKCVKREDHSMIQPPIHIPGTARWRWLLADETSWTRCIEGCCEIDMEMN
jgi:hypothetical protein